jgi:hypothetical protein
MVHEINHGSMKTFLSSTYIDLKEYRQAASEALERLGHKVNRMEIFGARPDEPKEACLKEIDECDLFVGIYAYRYGYVPSGSLISITEQEYNHAIQKGRPAFCFFINEDHPWLPKLVDSGPERTKLNNLKTRIQSERTEVSLILWTPLRHNAGREVSDGQGATEIFIGV